VATSCRFLTGHARDGGEQELLDSTVAGAADPHTTLVVYMGLQVGPAASCCLVDAHPA
jgi:uroporphyrin-III C-methyltransferase